MDKSSTTSRGAETDAEPARAEIFRPVVACNDLALLDGIIMGSWLAESLFIGIERLAQEDANARNGLCYLGGEIMTEMEAKATELAKRLMRGAA